MYVAGTRRPGCVLVVVDDDVVVLEPSRPGVVVESRGSLDPSRPVVSLSCRDVHLDDDEVLHGAAPTAIALGRSLAAAEAAGAARACLEMATAYA